MSDKTKLVAAHADKEITNVINEDLKSIFRQQNIKLRASENSVSESLLPTTSSVLFELLSEKVINEKRNESLSSCRVNCICGGSR